MDLNRSSPASTISSSTLIMTPATSSSTPTQHGGQRSPPPLAIPQGSLQVTALSATSWRTPYPRIGQFARTLESDEIVAAGPNGLFYFKRIRDHISRPWTEARPLPNTRAMLNSSSVSGLAIHSSGLRLDVYCVAGGVLHNFYRSKEDGSSFVVNPSPPLSTFSLVGTPAVVTTRGHWDRLQQWSLVVPCVSGGLLHTSTTSSSEWSKNNQWEPVDHVAIDLGIISAVSIATTEKKSVYSNDEVSLVAVCIARARLYTVEGSFKQESGYSSRGLKWRAQAPTRIDHPGAVTGNPVLAKKYGDNQLDLLVPSAEGGVFHFVRTKSFPDEWHMIGRIKFPQGLPAASCLAFNISDYDRKRFSALVQSGGQLYQIRTLESASPWTGKHLKPIVGPGPFSD
ncbi:hypothetical protein F5Y14DRAFT_424705 [Nemania sp. NC0429]|nr:hypothetical protein F5Y14DRAFT_424705 [Nemania sp. NC0429]